MALAHIPHINSPADLRNIPVSQLPKVCEEYRTFLIDTISKTGGHLGASLGAVELNVALHYVLNTPKDKICWDVGHQAYVHKMITGRRERMPTLRKGGGLSGFPSPMENLHDHFIVPLGSSLWSTDPQTFKEFPLRTFIRFFKNHGFLNIINPFKWLVIKGGSERYVEKLTAAYTDKVRLNSAVKKIKLGK